MVTMGMVWKHSGWHIAAVNRLLRVLNPAAPRSVTFHTLSECYANPYFKIYSAELDDGCGIKPIVAMATLFFQRIPSGWIAEVHDVCRDENFRGQGIGGQLMAAILDDVRRHAKEHRSSVRLSLTSKPERVDANTLYLRVGFRLAAAAVDERGTNLYVMTITP